MALYQEFRYCRVPNPDVLGNGFCNNFNFLFNTKACGFDGGDCLDFNKERPGCKACDINRVGDGYCDGPEYNNKACGYDGGDCEDFNKKFPGCKAGQPYWIENNSCQAAFDRPGVMTEECKWDNGQCGHLLKTGGDLLGNITAVELATIEGGLSALYPNSCDMGHVPYLTGNGICEDERLNTEECGWEAGDCVEWNKKYPGCAELFTTSMALCSPKLGLVVGDDETCHGNTQMMVPGILLSVVTMEEIASNFASSIPQVVKLQDHIGLVMVSHRDSSFLLDLWRPHCIIAHGDFTTSPY